MKTTLYDVLGVARDADSATLTKAFRAIARKCHPDVAGDDPEKNRRFREARDAYDTLKDPVKRCIYDRGVEAPDSLMNLFHRPEGQRLVSAMLPSAPKATKPGVDTVAVVEADADILRDGGMIDVPFLTGVSALQVPPDACDRPFCRLQGLGEPGRNGGENGDHFVILVEKNR